MLAMEKRFPQLMPRDGAVSDLTGFPGVAYKATRYEPLCGNIGTDARYSASFDISPSCVPAMDAFADASTDVLVAIYDLTGSRVEEGMAGDGYDTCLCFALGQSGSGNLRSGICLYVNGDGQNDVWWGLSYDRILAGAHRPNMNRALPLCADVNVDDLEASWSATAAGFSTTTTTEAPKSTEKTARQTTEFVTSVFTAANGTPTTQTMTLTSEVPAPTADSGKQDGGMDNSDKIALGVGLGIGIPTLILMLIALSLQVRSRERRKRATAKAEAAAAVAQNPGIHWEPPPRYADYDRR